MSATANPADAGGISADEIAKFSALAAQWWEPRGPMRPLHAMNPLRVGWIADQVRRQLGRAQGPLLDVGCGAGLAAEALADLGFSVLGLDASDEAITAARAHARLTAEAAVGPGGGARELAYRCGGIADLLGESPRFDCVTALEVIEHVPDQAGFVAGLAGLAAPGGVVVISTLNRTLASLAVAKIGAEYVARLLPRGTHDWRRFVPPEALGEMARAAGLRLIDMAGLSMMPGGQFRLSGDCRINYLAAFVKG